MNRDPIVTISLITMKIQETWEDLVVSLSNSASLTFDGGIGAILSE